MKTYAFFSIEQKVTGPYMHGDIQTTQKLYLMLLAIKIKSLKNRHETQKFI